MSQAVCDPNAEILVFDERLLDEKKYWITKLSSEIGPSSLKLDFPRSANHSEDTGVVNLDLSGQVYRQLNQLTNGGPFLIYTTLMAALKICLHKYTGGKSIVVGSPARKLSEQTSHKESEPSVAATGRTERSNAVAIIDSVERQLTFREFVINVRQTLLDAYERQHYGCDRLVKDLGLGDVVNKCPLFDVALTLEDIHGPLPNLKNDITITFIREPELLRGRIVFNGGLFCRETIERFAEHYVNVLQGALNNTNSRISDLSLVSEREQHHLVGEFNQTAARYPEQQCIQQLFEQQVERTPEATALSFGGEVLTYRELNERANQLAHHLVELGVEAEVKVGLLLERSIEMVVALLGVLKAGGAYLPLDPDYPQERLSWMIEDSEVPVLVTKRRLLEKNIGSSARAVCLDSEVEQISRRAKENPATTVSAENLAYVIYTSGSTGRPKGTLLHHRGLANLTAAQSRFFQMQPGDRILQFSSFSFDASVWEIFMALTSGATLFLAPPEPLMSASALVKLLLEYQITIATLPPALLAVTPPAALPYLRTLIVAGESCPPEVVRTWSPGRRFFNAYGPTETTVCATIYECDETAYERVPIGGALSNFQVYVLDEWQQLVPRGVVGELYVGGVGIARGYLNRAELTAEKFVPDPFSRDAGARLYRTGDLCRYVGDAGLEYVGRVDSQVKIRGYRVELGEVEEALQKLVGVKEAAVIVAEVGSQGDKRLAGYVVIDDGVATEVGEGSEVLKARLRESLPEYMVPGVITVLDQMPLTASGKVDRIALGKLAETGAVPGAGMRTSFAPPRDTLELQVAQIWEDLLKTSPIGIHDNFFELGGYSLLAVRLMARIQEHFGYELPLSTLFQGATIADFAAILRQQVVSTRRSPLIAIQPHGEKTPFICVHPAGGNVICYYHLARHMGVERPFYGLEAPDFTEIAENDDDYALIEDRAAAYITALRVLQPNGPYFLGGYSFGGTVAFEMAQQLTRQGEQVALLAMLDAVAPVFHLGMDDAGLLVGLAQEVAVQAGKILQLSTDDLEEYTLDEQITLTVERLRSAGALPPDIPPDIALTWGRRVMSGFRTRSRSIEKYVAQQYPGPITLFLADRHAEKVNVRNEAVRHILKLYQDPAHGWTSLSPEPIRIIRVPGYHATILFERNAKVLAENLNIAIQGAETGLNV